MAIDFREIRFVGPFLCLLDRGGKSRERGSRSGKVAQIDLQSPKMIEL